jgi:HEAT repeat protein/PBS lyase HEAT-like repeat-containing protein
LHAKHPDDRFESAAEVVRILEKRLERMSSKKKSAKQPARRVREEQPRSWLAPALALGGLALALLFACAGIGIFFTWTDEQPKVQKQVAQQLPVNERQEPGNLQMPPQQFVPQPAPRGPAPKVTGNPEIDDALADLGDINPFTTPPAAKRLAAMKPKEHRAVVAQRLAALADAGDPHIRRPVVHALAVWATPKEMPTLVKALQHTDVFTRREALKEIGKLRDKSTIAPIVRCFQDFHTRAEAGAALRDLGPMAEKEVLTLMDQTDVFLKQAAIDVLRDIGTPASIPALNAALASNNIFLTDHARAALTAIETRAKMK